MTRLPLRRHPQHDAPPGTRILRSVDRRTSGLLTLVEGNPLLKHDRERIIATIHNDAVDHHGRISTNRVRQALTDEHGRIVLPQLIGAMYSCLARSGAIEVAGREISDDEVGHHCGTIIRTWRLAERWLP